jgi:polyisoprenoid-binding protein YceI
MKSISFILIGMALLLSACASQATPQSLNTPISQVEPTLPVEPTSPPPTEAVTPDPSPTASDEPQSVPTNAGPITLQIVPGESQVSYEVGEVFLNQGNRFNLAKGITSQVTGEVTLDLQNTANSQVGEIQVDISQFQSDSPRRDNAIRDRFLESARFPIATFVPKDIQVLPDTYQEGQSVNLKITGDLTVREVTQPVTFDVTLQYQGDTLSGEATTTILMSDFQVGPISMAGILNTEDEVKLVLNFVARP